MSFPLDYQKSFCWPVDRRYQKQIIENFIRVAVDRLNEVQASDIQVDENSITFSVALFRFVTNWNLLTNLSGGSIEITAPDTETVCVAFYLNFSRLFFSLVLVGLIGAVWSAANRMVLEMLLPAAFFTAAVALNYGITAWRFSGFIRKIFDRAASERYSPRE